MFKRNLLLVVLVLSMLLSLVGCKKQPKDEENSNAQADVESSEETSKYRIAYIKDMYELERGNFYVYREGLGYTRPYFGITNFSGGATSASSSRVAWFMDDFDLIPTIYAGDSIVFRTLSEFSETFYLERFYDTGYTFGLCLLSLTKTGRYKLSTGTDDGTLNRNSDAAKLAQYGDINVTIDAVGGEFLRGEMVSSSGTVRGLEKDKDYDVDLYVGTELQDTVLKADSRCLVSAEVRTTMDYHFLQSDIIMIEMPYWLNSGYYSINGSGIFRFVNDEAYDDSTDFNIPNPNSEEDYLRQLEIKRAPYMEQTEAVEFPAEGMYEIKVTYDDAFFEELFTEDDLVPVEAALYFNQDYEIGVPFTHSETENSLTVISAAPQGAGEIILKNLMGRGFTIEVNPYVPEETESSAVQEESSVPQQEESSAATEESSAAESSESSAQ